MKKNLFSVLLFFVFAICNDGLFAQPSNDAICSATALTAGLSCSMGTNAAATSAGTPATPSCWLTAPTNDVWFSFVATASDMTVSTDVSGTTLTDTQIAIYSSSNNTCTGTLTLVGCDEDGGVNSAFTSIESMTGLTVGNTYFIRVDGYSTNTGTFCISVADTYTPGSSPCEAQVVYPNSAACSVANGNMNYNSTLGMSTVGTNYCGCDNETAQYGTWSTFTATSTGTYTITNETAGGNATPVDYTIFSGSSCTSLSCISCTSVAKGGTTTFATTSGTTYYILTTLQSGSTAQTRTDFCVQSSTACTAPTNNSCATATSVSSGTTYTTTTLCATPDGTLCSGSMENNLWYSWTCPPTWTGTSYFQMFNQNCVAGDVSNGSQVSIYPANVACTPTGTACATYSNLGTDNNVNIVWTPTAGSTYLITFDGNAGEVCQMNFQISNTPVIVLPIELLEFTAERQDEESVIIQWSTASEKRNDYFTVEKSTDGVHFESIGMIDVNGDSYTIKNYSMIDPEPAQGVNYYRLRQTDIDKTITFSEIEEVHFDKNVKTLTLSPNPTGATCNILVKCKKSNKEANLKVVDASGVMIMNKEVNCSNGLNTLELDLTGKSSGLYFVVLTVDGKVYREKLIKVN